jgi:hypothetical protein
VRVRGNSKKATRGLIQIKKLIKTMDACRICISTKSACIIPHRLPNRCQSARKKYRVLIHESSEEKHHMRWKKHLGNTSTSEKQHRKEITQAWKAQINIFLIKNRNTSTDTKFIDQIMHLVSVSHDLNLSTIRVPLRLGLERPSYIHQIY